MSKTKSISGNPIKLSRVRLSFPQLHAAVGNKAFPDSPPAFGASFLLDPNDPTHRATIQAINAEIKRLREEAWNLGGKAHPKEETKGFPFGKGDTKVNDAGEIYGGYEGMYFVSARSNEKNKPRTLNVNRQDITDPKEIEKLFYGGCYVTASVNFWVQNNAAGKAIRCGLRGVQFVKDGEAFGGGRAGDDEFDELEDDDDLGLGDADGFDDDISF
jgi:hypothetical protein